MNSRRRLKSERELVSDMKKTFEKFCSKRKCNSIDCEYFYEDDCCSAYIMDLLKKNKKKDDLQELRKLKKVK